MTSIRTILIKCLFLPLLVLAIHSASASAYSVPTFDCKTSQCVRFKNWGFSPEISRHGETLAKIMRYTNIEVDFLSVSSFLEAIESNWGHQSNNHEYYSHPLELYHLMQKLGMYRTYNELSTLSSNDQKLLVIILGGHPDQLCSAFTELSPLRKQIDITLLIGSNNAKYNSLEYTGCQSLDSSQIEALKSLDKKASDRDIMNIYFRDLRFRTMHPATQQSMHLWAGSETDFINNQILQNFLKYNTFLTTPYQHIILAAPQPYTPEAMSILRSYSSNNPTIYRLTSFSQFNIHEGLYALRNWLRTDYNMNQ